MRTKKLLKVAGAVVLSIAGVVLLLPVLLAGILVWSDNWDSKISWMFLDEVVHNIALIPILFFAGGLLIIWAVNLWKHRNWR